MVRKSVHDVDLVEILHSVELPKCSYDVIYIMAAYFRDRFFEYTPVISSLVSGPFNVNAKIPIPVSYMQLLCWCY